MNNIVIDKKKELYSLLGTYFSNEEIQYIDYAIDILEKNNVASEIILQKIEVAKIAFDEANLKSKALVAMFIFELFETSVIDKKKIIELFGEKVAGILDGLIKVYKINTSKSKINSENYIKLLLSQADDVRVILILLILKLYKIRKVADLNDNEKIVLCEELSSLYAPLAHRLGLYKVKTEMEELSMKHLHYDIYKSIAKKLSETKKERDLYIDNFIAPIKTALENKKIKFSIKGRPKSIHSIWNKLKKNNAKFESIYDLFAIRIIIDSTPENEKSDCWHVYSIVSDIYRPNPNRLRDWISAPKISGYESLHTTVVGPEGRWVEVQIRTERMDEIAEKGHAAHWKYKEGENAVGSTGWLANVRNALENPNISDLEDSSSRIELYSNEIFIFTPAGDLRKISAGATILDFAYELHTNIGSSCTGGKVNGKIVPIKHSLSNGDQVEILTSKTQTPKRDWLHFVKTSKAKSRIKKYLKESEFKNAEEGKDIIMRKLNQIKVKFGDDSVFKMVKHYKLKDSLDLYLKAVEEKIDFSELKVLFSPDKNEDEKKPNQIDVKDFTTKVHKRINSGENFLIIDDNVDNIDFRLAKCCKPIKGDDIFGFLTASGGLTLHRVSCPNAPDLLSRYPYRVVKTKWTASNNTDSKFLVGIKVIGVDEIGIISTITSVISRDLQVKMRNINVISNDDTFEGEITLYIEDNQHLDALLKKLRGIKGVYSAERYTTQ